MKRLPLHNTSFRYLEKSFGQWLDILGYAPFTVYSMPNHIREFLHYLEQQGCKQIRQLETNHITDHYERLKTRANSRKGGALSSSHLNKHIQALRKFLDYLRQTGRMEVPELPLQNEPQEEKEIPFLTEKEIKQLFEATEKTYPPSKRENQFVEALKSRDRAMLAILYGCGARRNEAIHLNTGDINFDRSVLHIKKGKKYKERLVPIGKTALRHLQQWVYDYRGEYLKSSKTEALFISERGTRINSQSLLLRLKLLQQLTENEELKNKEIGLHTLRHSIATHLLANGMKLESISRFLGHSSLESTQIYTHLLHEKHVE